MPSQSSDLKHILKYWIILKDHVEVLVLEAINLCLHSTRSYAVAVLVADLEDVAYVTDVAALFEQNQFMLPVFVGNVDRAIVYEIDAGAHFIQRKDGITGLEVLVLKGSDDLSDQLVVSLEAKLGIQEEYVEPFLEGQHQILLDDFHLEVG